MRERLASPPAPEILQYLYGPRLAEQRVTLFSPMMMVNQAHVVMLARQGIIDRAAAVKLLREIRALEASGPDGMEWNAALEDVHLNIEAQLIARLGPEVGGRMHTARSRNDLYATVNRIYVRERLLGAAEQLLALRGQMLDLASAHAETIMTGYTHMQPAQPITFGHYLSGVAAGLEREDGRMAAAYASANRSPMGACALAGTSFPIDRALVADLLGFDGVLTNTLDAVATRDYVGDALYALAMAGTVLSRCATDLHHWCSFEYGFVELSDAAAGTSSIMPQKKNPMPLEHTKAKAAHLVGALVSAMGCWKTTPYAHGREVSTESVQVAGDAFTQVAAACALMACSLRGLKVNGERMRAALDRNFAVATDFADALVQEGGLPFRTAHQVVAAAVRKRAERGDAGLNADAVLAAMREMGLSTKLPAERLTLLASPEEAVRRRAHPGGPAPEEVRRMVGQQQEVLEAHRQAWAGRRGRLDEASERLEQAVSGFVG
ncbi:MAG: argininosuccinate lyase [Armatimonadetes bacterium]|nr:argininosuccinate lyase [Armatimonadota bacterium]